jgi:hypothetical protein
MKLEISDEHGKALQRIHGVFYGFGTLSETVEHMIQEFLIEERGRLGRINDGKFESSEDWPESYL